MTTLGSARLRRRSSDSRSTLEKLSCRLRPLTSSLSTCRADSASPGTHNSAISPGRGTTALVLAPDGAREPVEELRELSTATPRRLVLAGRLVASNAGGAVK